MQETENNTDIIGSIYIILLQVAYCVALYRSLHKRRDNGIGTNEEYIKQFWVSTMNNALMMAAVNWCKVFGTKGNNHTHYSLVIGDEEETFLRSLKDIGIDFSHYSKSMREFRDKYIAHWDNYDSPVPDFDIALQVIYCFDEIVIKKAFMDVAGYGSLCGSYNNYKESIEDYLDELHIAAI